MADSFWSQVQHLAEEAPEAGFAAINYGKLVATPMILKWERNGEVRTPVRTPLKAGQTIGEGESLEINFKILISELNPNLQFDYERSIPVRKSGRVKTDWSEIVLPSLEATFGKNWAQALEKQPYVEVEDVGNIQGKTSSTTGKVYGVPKFLRVFKGKAEAMEARAKRFPPREGEVPESETSSGELNAVPEEVLLQVKSLIASVGPKKAKKMLENKPFGEYDADDLLQRASEAEEE